MKVAYKHICLDFDSALSVDMIPQTLQREMTTDTAENMKTITLNEGEGD